MMPRSEGDVFIVLGLTLQPTPVLARTSQFVQATTITSSIPDHDQRNHEPGMASILTGVQYHIYTSHQLGGYLQFLSGDTGVNATTGSDIEALYQLVCSSISTQSVVGH
jgi:hypothetical protein